MKTYEQNYPKLDRQAFLFAILLSVALAANTFYNAGCSTTQEAQVSALADAVAPLVADYASTGQVTYAQAIPAALNSVAIFAPSIQPDVATIESTITNAVSAFTNGTGASTGQKIATAILNALPANATGSQVNTAIVQAGVGASTGANP